MAQLPPRAPDAPLLDSLSADRDFVRRLARSLLRDANDVDDVTQQAWLAGRAADPAHRRGYLATLVRNLVHRRHRQARRRADRERAAARGEAQPSTVDVLEFEATRKQVVDAVLALPEPYRGTVVAVYYEGAAPREIARRLGVPAATVRSHLHRAHAMLRARLERIRPGPARGWSVALALLAGTAQSSASGATVAVVAALALLAAGAWGTRSSWLPEAAVGSTPAPTVADGPDARPALPERESIAAPGVAPATRPETGTIVHTGGAPAGGLLYWFESAGRDLAARRDRPQAAPDGARRTAADGSFVWPATPGVLWVHLDAGHLLAVDLRHARPGATVRLPPAAPVEVRIAGAGEAAATVELWPAWLQPDGRLAHGHTCADVLPGAQPPAFLHRQRRLVEGTANLQVGALEGFRYHLRARVAGFELHEEDDYVRAPALVTRTVTRPAPVWRVRVLEPDGGGVTTRDGLVLVAADQRGRRVAICTRLERGTAAPDLGSMPAGADALLRVFLDDGEVLEQRLSRDGGGSVELRCGTGTRALLIEAPAEPTHRLYLHDGVRAVPVTRLEPGVGYENPVLLWHTTADGRLALPGAPPAWQRLVSIARDGRIAVAEPDRPFRGLPALRRLRQLTMADVARLRPAEEGFLLRFEVQPPDLGDAWLVADEAAFSPLVDRGPQTWHKWVTAGVPYRFTWRPGTTRDFVPIDVGR